jgi:cytoskeleton protein RodZ
MPSFGEELRRHRELRSISLREIADATKINIRFLESLENNDFTHLPGGQFNKGFIRAYARHIGLEGEGMVDAYLLEMRRQEEAERAQGKQSGARSRRRSSGNFPARVAGVFVALVLVGACVLGYWLLKHRGGAKPVGTDAPAAASPSTGHPAAETPPPAPPASSDSSVATAPPPAPSGSALATPTPIETPAAGQSAPVASAGEASAPAPTPAPEVRSEPTRSEGAPSGDLNLLVMPSAKGRLHLQCAGRELYRGTLEPGKMIKLLCPGLLVVTMSDAGAASFSINGERVYLGPPGRRIAGRHISSANYMDFTKPPVR